MVFYVHYFSKMKSNPAKKLQSNVSHVNQSPRAKIRLYFRTFNNSRKIFGTFLPAAFQLYLNSLVYAQNILGSSLKVFGELCLPSEILEFFIKFSENVWKCLCGQRKVLGKFWRIFVNLQEVVGNLQKISNMLLSVYFTCITNKIINDCLKIWNISCVQHSM